MLTGVERREYDPVLVVLCSHVFRFVSCALSLAQTVKSGKELERLPIWKLVKSLAQDSIVDVRIGIARLIANVCGKLLVIKRSGGLLFSI
jgi:hypothetical protein